jgi:hypothetical protein
VAGKGVPERALRHQRSKETWGSIGTGGGRLKDRKRSLRVSMGTAPWKSLGGEASHGSGL